MPGGSLAVLEDRAGQGAVPAAAALAGVPLAAGRRPAAPYRCGRPAFRAAAGVPVCGRSLAERAVADLLPAPPGGDSVGELPELGIRERTGPPGVRV